MVRDPSAHGGGGAKVFRGPTPVSGAQDRGSNAGALVRRVVGRLLAMLKQHKKVRVITVEELPPEPERLLGFIEATWGTETRERLVTWIKTRCEEDFCDRDYSYCCSYCGKRLCEEHANYGEGRIIYCREHVDPDARLCYIVLVDRMR
jgi:hypothetical protein